MKMVWGKWTSQKNLPSNNYHFTEVTRNKTSLSPWFDGIVIHSYNLLGNSRFYVGNFSWPKSSIANYSSSGNFSMVVPSSEFGNTIYLTNYYNVVPNTFKLFVSPIAFGNNTNGVLGEYVSMRNIQNEATYMMRTTWDPTDHFSQFSDGILVAMKCNNSSGQLRAVLKPSIDLSQTNYLTSFSTSDSFSLYTNDQISSVLNSTTQMHEITCSNSSYDCTDVTVIAAPYKVIETASTLSSTFFFFSSKYAYLLVKPNTTVNRVDFEFTLLDQPITLWISTDPSKITWSANEANEKFNVSDPSTLRVNTDVVNSFVMTVFPTDLQPQNTSFLFKVKYFMKLFNPGTPYYYELPYQGRIGFFIPDEQYINNTMFYVKVLSGSVWVNDILTGSSLVLYSEGSDNIFARSTYGGVYTFTHYPYYLSKVNSSIVLPSINGGTHLVFVNFTGHNGIYAVATSDSGNFSISAAFNINSNITLFNIDNQETKYLSYQRNSNEMEAYFYFTSLSNVTNLKINFYPLQNFSGQISSSSLLWQDLLSGNVNFTLNINPQYRFSDLLLVDNEKILSLFSSLFSSGGAAQQISSILSDSVMQNESNPYFVVNNASSVTIKIPAFNYTPTADESFGFKVLFSSNNPNFLIMPQNTNYSFTSDIVFQFQQTGQSTQLPTTQSPSTQAPSTIQSTSQSPSTQAPFTIQSTSQSTSTQSPATQTSSTIQSTSQSTSTQFPETQTPSTIQSTSQSTSTQLPVTQLPVTQLPVTQLPVTQSPM